MTLILLPYNVIFTLPNHRILLHTKHSKIHGMQKKGISFIFLMENIDYSFLLLLFIFFIYFY